MKGFIAKRMVTTAVTLLVLITVNFLLFRIIPGDPTRLLFRDPRAKPEQLRMLREKFGLDLPLTAQFIMYIYETFHGNLGWSFHYNQPVFDVIASKIPNTLLLVGSSAILSAVVGIMLGAIAGWKRGTKLDSILFTSSLISSWLPTFWLGTMLLLAFGYWFKIFPIGGIVTVGVRFSSVFEYWADVLWHMALPMLSMLFWYVGEYFLLMRSSMLDVLTEDYMVTARAKGLKESVILRDHALRNALLPVVTLTTINLGFVVAGAIQTETVFAWPGIGNLAYTALIHRDYPLLQGTFLILSICVILANFVADLIYGYLDPRVRVAA